MIIRPEPKQPQQVGRRAFYINLENVDMEFAKEYLEEIKKDIRSRPLYKVTCDETNNTPESIARNELYIDFVSASVGAIPIKVGIAPQATIRERILSIAKGELKPKSSDPKIWFNR